jgi:uncharacterized protein (DUF39 family)
MVEGVLMQMSADWLRGVSIQGYGCSLAVGLGVPIPILNEEMARFTGVSNEEIFTHVVDYGHDYTNGIVRDYGKVSYADLQSGRIEVAGKKVAASPLSSVVKAREIAEILKHWIMEEKFHLGEPVDYFPTVDFSFNDKK